MLAMLFRRVLVFKQADIKIRCYRPTPLGRLLGVRLYWTLCHKGKNWKEWTIADHPACKGKEIEIGHLTVASTQTLRLQFSLQPDGVRMMVDDFSENRFGVQSLLSDNGRIQALPNLIEEYRATAPQAR